MASNVNFYLYSEHLLFYLRKWKQMLQITFLKNNCEKLVYRNEFMVGPVINLFWHMFDVKPSFCETILWNKSF